MQLRRSNIYFLTFYSGKADEAEMPQHSPLFNPKNQTDRPINSEQRYSLINELALKTVNDGMRQFLCGYN